MSIKVRGAGTVKFKGAGRTRIVTTAAAQPPSVVTFQWTPSGSPSPSLTFTSDDLKIKNFPGVGNTPVYVDAAFVKDGMGGGSLRVLDFVSNNPYGADNFDASVYDIETANIIQSTTGRSTDDETFTVDSPSAGDIIIVDSRIGPVSANAMILLFSPAVATLVGITWP